MRNFFEEVHGDKLSNALDNEDRKDMLRVMNALPKATSEEKRQVKMWGKATGWVDVGGSPDFWPVVCLGRLEYFICSCTLS